MRHRKTITILCMLMMVTLLSTSAFAVSESDVESAIAASSQEEVAGNLLIWFLCAVSFLKISQKIDSFMTSLGINVGRTGGSMLAEMMIAGRALGEAVKATGGAVGSIFNRGHSSNTTNATGQAFTGGGNGMLGIAKRAVGNAAAASATERGSGIGSFVGGAMFGSSLNSGGKFATDVVGAVATGNIATVGSITGAKAAQALTSYLGYSAEGGGVTPSGGSVSASGVTTPSAGADVTSEAGISSGPAIPAEPIGNEDVITVDGGIAGAGVPFAADTPAGEVVSGAAHVTAADEVSTAESKQHQIPAQPPTFRDVEIGGGRITGYETPADGGAERRFAMYNAGQYMTPTGAYETVETADGETWYKQYAQPTVERTPYEESSGQIKYNEKIVEQMPQIPKRKDRV